jgi:hypothetical protein
MGDVTEDEDVDFAGAIKGRFQSRGERTEARLQAERRAGRTPKQRASKRGPPKTQINIRITAEAKAALDALVAQLESTQTDVMEMAIKELAARSLKK